MSNIFQNKKYWEKMSEVDLNQYASDIFQYYRNVGFPDYVLFWEEREKEFLKLKQYSGTVLEGDTVKQTMHGLGLAWHYFPHWKTIRCGNMKTPMEVFESDSLFMQCIWKRLKHGTYISDSGMRKILRLFTGTQAVSNFRPTAARAIYDTFAGDGTVYDMSSGFGGRLLGALCSNKVTKYIGTDPSVKTYKGLVEMSDNFKHLGKEIVLFNKGSEDVILNPETVDLCFTSPPYYNTEKYADEPTQSYLKFPDKQSWVECFLRKTLFNCHIALKKTGYLIVNIANVKTFPDLETVFLHEANQTGFQLQKGLKYALSSINKTGFKYENIFIFCKK